MDEKPTKLQQETPYLIELQEALSKSSFDRIRARKNELIAQLNQLQIDYQAYINTWRSLHNGKT